MQSLFNFIVKPKHGRYDNKKNIDDSELLLTTEISDHRYVSRTGIVIATPKQNNTNIKTGDEVIVHHNVFRRWHNARGKEKNSASYIKEDLYKVSVDQIFAYRKITQWHCLPGYTFIKPIQGKNGQEAKQIGVVKYSDGSFKKDELVGYNPAGEYEFIIDNERLYRVNNKFIEIKYEYTGKEKEYNPSWLQSS